MRLQPEHCLLYAVTDRHWLNGRTLAQDVEAAIRGGVTMVQLREKELPEAEFEREALQVQEVCRRYGVPFLINDNVALAIRIGADGVHVGQSDMEAGDVRALIGPDKILGVTAKTVPQALAAQAAGADYLGSGAVFGTLTKPDAIPLDHALFQEICESVSIPVVAIGNVNESNLLQLAGRGMKGFAIVSAIFAAEDITSACRRLRCLAQAAASAPDGGPAALLTAIRSIRPVVQCITNIVTVNDCANALLAIGASPTMAHHQEEMSDFARICDALVLNMGATECLEAMQTAGRIAAEKGHSIVIDPVGCAGSGFRREKCLALIDATHPTCIRGNAAEIRALALHRDTGRGVDDPETESIFGSAQAAPRAADLAEQKIQTATHDLTEIITDAQFLSRQTDAIVIATGPVDVIAYEDKVFTVHNGSAWMARITGSGCVLSSLLGAFLTAERSAESAAACCAFLGVCGELAEARTVSEAGGTSTFRIRLIDALSLCGEQDLKGVKISTIA